LSNLGDALEGSRQMVRKALAEARADLETITSRQAELEQQIAAAESVLGQAPSSAQSSRSMTLHDALAQVLREGDNEGMTARALAEAVTRRPLYRSATAPQWKRTRFKRASTTTTPSSKSGTQ
jgi:hypothetical protein